MIAITLGKFIPVQVNVNLSNGGLDSAATLNVATNQPSSIKVAVNPANNREIGIVAMAATTGAEVHVSLPGFDISLIVSVPTPTITGISFGAIGTETDPPAWALA